MEHLFKKLTQLLINSIQDINSSNNQEEIDITSQSRKRNWSTYVSKN